MKWRIAIAGIAAALGACAVDPYASIAVVSAEPEGVTVRYVRDRAGGRLSEATRLAEAQCARFGRGARLEWDVELVAEVRGWPNAGGYERTTPPHRLRDSGNHHARFACIEAAGG